MSFESDPGAQVRGHHCRESFHRCAGRWSMEPTPAIQYSRPSRDVHLRKRKVCGHGLVGIWSPFWGSSRHLSNRRCQLKLWAGRLSIGDVGDLFGIILIHPRGDARGITAPCHVDFTLCFTRRGIRSPRSPFGSQVVELTKFLEWGSCRNEDPHVSGDDPHLLRLVGEPIESDAFVFGLAFDLHHSQVAEQPIPAARKSVAQSNLL